MNSGIAFIALSFALYGEGHDHKASSPQVKVTKTVAIMSLRSDGTIVDVSESKIGKSFSLVREEKSYLVLDDASGNQFRIERSATDYTQLPTLPPDALGEPLSKKALAGITPDGVASLTAMAADRPAILTVIKPHDAIWNWLAYYFSNPSNPIGWTRTKPTYAVSSYASNWKSDGTICIWFSEFEGKVQKSPQDQLSNVIFELLNDQHGKEFRKMFLGAKERKISEHAFERGMARIEFQTVQELKTFYALVWLPYAQQKNLRPDDGYWELHASDDFEEWMKNKSQASRYPQSYHWLYVNLSNGREP